MTTTRRQGPIVVSFDSTDQWAEADCEKCGWHMSGNTGDATLGDVLAHARDSHSHLCRVAAS